jgi:hypothetical protein
VSAEAAALFGATSVLMGLFVAGVVFVAICMAAADLARRKERRGDFDKVEGWGTEE